MNHSSGINSQDQGIKQEDVVAAFRLILDRRPGSEDEIRAYLGFKDMESLGKALIDRQEFRLRYLQSPFSKSKWVATEVMDRWMMWVDLHDRHVSAWCLANTWEPNETGFFVSRLHAGAVVLDIGANIGWFSLVAAKHIGPTGRVHAFEPRPDTFRMLAKTVALNDLNAIIHPWEYALSNEAGELMINWGHNTDNPGGSFVTKSTASGCESARVRAVRLDDLLPEVAPDLIKIDVEGAEPLVFEGAVKCLKRRRPTILSELLPCQLATVSGRTPAQYIQQMEELGYACYLLEDSKPTRRLKDFPQECSIGILSCVFEWQAPR